MAIRKRPARGRSGKKNQTVIAWAMTILAKLREPASRITGKRIRLIATSYEIICAAERSAPIKAYFELLDQPARIIL
jgi:hypothetical protein